MIYLLGYSFGPDVIYTYEIAFIIATSYLIAQGYIAGHGLSNAKTYLESKFIIK